MKCKRDRQERQGGEEGGDGLGESDGDVKDER